MACLSGGGGCSPLPSERTSSRPQSADPRQDRFSCTGDLEPFVTASDALDDLPKPLIPQRPHTDVIHEISLYDANRVTPHSCSRWLSIDDQGRYY